MNPWSIVDALVEIIDFFVFWRFYVCVIAGLALAGFATSVITSESLHWIVAGPIIIASAVIGLRWERST